MIRCKVYDPRQLSREIWFCDGDGGAALFQAAAIWLRKHGNPTISGVGWNLPGDEHGPTLIVFYEVDPAKTASK